MMKSIFSIVLMAYLCCAVSIFSAPASDIAVSGANADMADKPIDTTKLEVKNDTLKRDSIKTGWGSLRIISTPDSAVVVVDSVSRGTTPIIIDSLVPGEHTLLIKKKGCFVKKISVAVAADTIQALSVNLVKPGGLVVKSDPAGSRLFLNDKESGTTPWENFKLKPGDYTVRLEDWQRETVEKRVTVKDGQCDTISVSMLFTKAYTDSLAIVNQRQGAAKHKANLITNLAVFGTFLVFGLVIIAIEASNNN